MVTIEDFRLPAQLVTYFQESKRISDYLNENVLNDIEELYTMYKSLYFFDETEFSKYVIKCVERCKDIDGFYYYLKKVIDSNVELTSKGRMKNGILSLEEDYVNKLFKEISSRFLKDLEDLNNGWGIINMKSTYLLLGKLELICELFEDEFFSDVLLVGRSIIEKYELQQDKLLE